MLLYVAVIGALPRLCSTNALWHLQNHLDFPSLNAVRLWMKASAVGWRIVRLLSLSTASFEFGFFLFCEPVAFVSELPGRRWPSSAGTSRARRRIPSLSATLGCTAAEQKKLQWEIRSAEKQLLSLSLPLFLPARPYHHRVRKIIHDPFLISDLPARQAFFWKEPQNAIEAFMQGYSDEPWILWSLIAALLTCKSTW